MSKDSFLNSVAFRLFLAKVLFLSSSLSSVGWNRFQNNFYLDNGLSSSQIGNLKAVGLVFKFIGDPVVSYIADITDDKIVFIITMIMQVFSMEFLRFYQKSLTFTIILLVKLLRSATAPSTTLITVAALKLSEGTNEGYGNQRMMGSLGWGAGAWIAGYLIDKFGMDALFYYTYFFQITCLLFVVFGLSSKFSKSSYKESGENGDLLSESSAVDSDKDVIKVTVTEKWYKSMITSFLQKSNLNELKIFLMNEKTRLVLLNSIFYGCVMTVVDTFLYISLEKDYHVSRTLSGFSTTVSTLSCLPLFWYSETFIRKFGHHSMIFISQIICVIRLFIYAIIPLHNISGVYIVIVVQLLHGFNFALYFASAVDIIFKIAPKDLSVSCVSVLNLCYFTIGGAIGNALWGYMYDAYGIRLVYFLSSLLCLLNTFHLLRRKETFISGSNSNNS